MEVGCPRCDALNPPEAIFCASCGGQLRSALERDSGPLNLSRSAAPTVARSGIDAPAPPPFIAPPPPPLPSASFAPSAPAPAAPVVPQPASRASYTSPSYAMPDHAAPPPPPYNPGHYAPAAYGGAPYGAAPYGDVNTSGMGPGYPLPYQTQGWTFAGFVPFGLFAFVNGSVLWGVLYWLLSFFGVSLVYNIYVGIKGRELAWQSRRFDSLQQFEETMAAWNRWGIISLIASVLLIGIFFVAYMMLVFSLVAGDLASGM